VGFSVDAYLHHFDIHHVLAQLPEQTWTPTYQVRPPRAGEHGPVIEPRDGAWVAEATGLVELSAWPAGTRLILRRERPHPARSYASPTSMATASSACSPTPPAGNCPTWSFGIAATPASKIASFSGGS
jgi:hypothetical protein